MNHLIEARKRELLRTQNIITPSPMRVLMVLIKSKLNRNFLEVMNRRTINDITLKVKVLKQKSNEELFSLFSSMCDWGLNAYVDSMKKMHPEKTRAQILKDHYLKTRKERCR